MGPLCSTVGTPFELIKLQMQLDTSAGGGGGGGSGGAQRQYTSAMDARKKLVGRHGVRVLYLGWRVNTVREIMFNTIFFSTFEHINHGRALHEY